MVHGAAEVSRADHDVDERDDDRHREITDEQDLADVAAEREADRRAVDDERQHPDAAETTIAEVHEDADGKAHRERDDQVRVPTGDETEAKISRARRALIQMDDRELADALRAAQQHRADQLARWHHLDRIHNSAHDRSDGLGF